MEVKMMNKFYFKYIETGFYRKEYLDLAVLDEGTAVLEFYVDGSLTWAIGKFIDYEPCDCIINKGMFLCKEVSIDYIEMYGLAILYNHIRDDADELELQINHDFRLLQIRQGGMLLVMTPLIDNEEIKGSVITELSKF